MDKKQRIKELEDEIEKRCKDIERIWGNLQDGSRQAAYYHEVRPLLEQLDKLKGEL